MSKVAKLYAKVTKDAALLASVQKIANGANAGELTDKQFQALADLGASVGVSVTPQEIKAYFAGGEGELSLDALDAVAGGKGGKEDVVVQNCEGKGSGAIRIENSETKVKLSDDFFG